MHTYNLYCDIFLQNWLIHSIREQLGLEGILKDHLVQDFPGRGIMMRLSSSLSTSQNLQWWGFHHVPGDVHLTVVFSHEKMKHLPVHSSHLVFSMWISWRESLGPLRQSFNEVLLWVLTQAFSLPGRKFQLLQSFLIGQVLQNSDHH